MEAARERAAVKGSSHLRWVSRPERALGGAAVASAEWAASSAVPLSTRFSALPEPGLGVRRARRLVLRHSRGTAKGVGFGGDAPGFRFQLCHLLAVQLRRIA